MKQTTIDLVNSVLELDRMIKSFNEDNTTYTEVQLHQARRRHEVVIVEALIEAAETEEIELVLFLLTPKEIGRLAVVGAKSKAPFYAKTG